MNHYTIQYNAREDSYTVFDENDRWVGMFREYGHAARFIKLVLNGTYTD